MSLQAAIAVNRFGLGAAPSEIASASGDPRQWLVSQIGPAGQPAPVDGEPFKDGATLVKDLQAFRQQRRELKQDGDTKDLRAFAKQQRQVLINEMASRFQQGFSSRRPFAERLVWFWSNHFTISVQNPAVASLAGAYEREAIRPHIAGKFEDMLLAVATHPAMLIYLNNAQSIGPDSPAGQLVQRGLNENFGRELMELYSLGVDGGYTQADVVALARLLTGWSIDIQPKGAGRMARLFQASFNQPETVEGASSGFRYFPARHEPGPVRLRGQTYADGFAGGRAAIHDLARDPATAKFIATKFARHFVSDAPPPQLVARLEKSFRDTQGDLKALTIAMIQDPSAWDAGAQKMRNPVEYVTASYRLLGLPRGENAEQQIKGAMQACRMMGHFPLAASSPKGWSDMSADWSGSDAILSRIEWAQALGARLPQTIGAGQIAGLADQALGEGLSQQTRSAIAAAPTGGEALALLVSSPEFQRR
ncbi:MAG TPA: DUF1800 domain-containing protein [Rhizomicrobium sp.]|nr:DUF1800 domain-containing protein [Rhizomicrobium sp.]